MSISAWHPKRGEKDKPEGANVALVDGSVHYLTNDMPAEGLRALLTPEGGERFTP